MIDERKLIRTLEKWKANQNEFTGLKAEAMHDKVIDEVINQSIDDRIHYGDAKERLCKEYCKYKTTCDCTVACPLDFL